MIPHIKFQSDLGVLIQKGATLPATINSCLLSNGKIHAEWEIESITNHIKYYIKGKENVTVSELVEYLGESADKVLIALRRLKDDGTIEEVD